MKKFSAILALAALLPCVVMCIRAEDKGLTPFNVKPETNNDKNASEIIKQAEQRIKVITEKINGKNHVKLNMDNLPLLDMPGTSASVKIEGDGANRAIVTKIDGKEISRVPLPNLNIKAADLPPLELPNIDQANVRAESRSVNGVSNTKVWVNGQVVYDGPGANSSSVSRNENGRKSVEVTVDGKVVYKAGEGDAAPATRKVK